MLRDACGDSVLIDVAARLEHCLRGCDFLFRIGGEEFVVIQPEADIEACRLLAEQLRDSIACEFFDVDGTMIPITISIGGTVISADTAVSNRQLFEFADRHLYQAKKIWSESCRCRDVWCREPSLTSLSHPFPSFLCIKAMKPMH